MKTMFSADPFSAPAAAPRELGQGAGCVLIGTETHPSDQETLFQRTIDKYEGLGWTIVRQETGRIFYDGTADETREANLWACPPDYRAVAEMERGGALGQVALAGGGPANVRSQSKRRRPFGAPAVVFPTSPTTYQMPRLMPTSPKPWGLEGSQVPARMGQVPGHPGIHWGIYNGERVRWPDCDPRYDPQCPYPTQIITDGPAMGQVGVVGGFGGPGGVGGFGFVGGPGGLVGGAPGPVAGVPSPASGPITGPSIPCGPAGYGPGCAWPPQATTVVQKVRPIDGVLGSGNRGSGAAHGRDAWVNPFQPCPPGYYRSAPGSPCVKEGDLEDYGEGYFQQRPW